MIGTPGNDGWVVVQLSYHGWSRATTADHDLASPPDQAATADRLGQLESDGDCATPVAVPHEPTAIMKPRSLSDTELMLSAPLIFIIEHRPW